MRRELFPEREVPLRGVVPGTGFASWLEVLELAGSGVRVAALAAVANGAGSAGVSHQKVLSTVSRAAAGSLGAVERLFSGG